jgi:Ca2+-dependent lipid-binding protein
MSLRRLLKKSYTDLGRVATQVGKVSLGHKVLLVLNVFLVILGVIYSSARKQVREDLREEMNHQQREFYSRR